MKRKVKHTLMGLNKYLLKINDREYLCHLLGLDDANAPLIHRLSKLGKSSPQSLEGKEISSFLSKLLNIRSVNQLPEVQIFQQ